MSTPTTQLEAAAVEAQFLELLRRFLEERMPGWAGGPISLNTHLENDLGVRSLDLVDLMQRCEEAFELLLPDDAAAEAETPADWVKTILEGSQQTAARPRYRVSPPRLDALSEPVTESSLAGALARHAETDPGRVHIHLLRVSEKDQSITGEDITFGGLYEDACLAAAGLADLGLRRNDTVALMLPAGSGFFAAFFGIMLAGGIPVPVYPPTRRDRLEDYTRRQIAVLRRTGVRYLISFPEARPIVQILRVNLPSLVEVTSVEDLRGARGRIGFGSVRVSDTAVLQFTSGSTGDPKAVALTHTNVLANIRAIGKAVEVRPGDALVTWLPLYSDLGLIGSWLFSLYHAIPCTVLSPLDFLKHPDLWLRAIHDSRGTLSAAPNFAYDLCARRVPASAIEGCDLSCWRVAVNAGEPVLPETVDRFSRRFQPYGFRPEALMPCYGLAESTVALTIPPPDRLPLRDYVDRREFEKRGRAVPARADASALCFFSAGHPVEGQQIRILDELGREAPERTVGRVLFRGVSSCAAYYRNPEETAAINRGDGWLDSGDYGYMAGGEFFFTGRSLDSIFKAGRSMSPHDVEALVGGLEGIVPGSAVAFGVADHFSGADHLVVVAETRAVSQEDFRRLEAEITRVVDACLGVPPDRVQLVRPGWLPRTQNGKVRRNELRALCARGRLRPGFAPPWLQIVRLRWENLGPLARLAARRIRVVTGRALTGLAVNILGWSSGGWVRLTGSTTAIRAACRVILGLHGRRYSVQGDVPAAPPAVLVANRPGWLDPLVLAAVLPGEIRFADRAALLGLPGPLRWLMEPMVLGHDRGRTVPASGELRDRIRRALNADQTVVVLPDSPVGEPASRSRYRLDPFRAAVEMGAPLIALSIRERAAQADFPERLRPRRVTMIIPRDPLPVDDPPDFHALRNRARAALGEYHA